MNLNKKLPLWHGTIPKFITLLVNLLNTTNLQPDVGFTASKLSISNHWYKSIILLPRTSQIDSYNSLNSFTFAFKNQLIFCYVSNGIF